MQKRQGFSDRKLVKELQFEPYNESSVLQDAVEHYKERTGPELRRKDSVRTAPVHVSGSL